MNKVQFTVYQAGLFRYTDYTITIILITLFLVFTANFVISILLIIFDRYTIMYPAQWQQIVHHKENLFLLFILHVIIDFIIAMILFSILMSTNEELTEIRQDFQRYRDLPSFFYYNHHKTKVLLCFVALLFSMANIMFVFIIILFMYRMKSNNGASYAINDIESSLTINVIVQILLVLCFMIIAPYCYIIFVYFQIQNTAYFIVTALCLNCVYFPASAITTLCLVLPYRKFITRLNFGHSSTVYPTTGFFPANEQVGNT